MIKEPDPKTPELDPIRYQLRRIYLDNLKGAASMGAWWAVDDFRSRLEHLRVHQTGPLTEQLKRDVAHFGGLIEMEEIRG